MQVPRTRSLPSSFRMRASTMAIARPRRTISPSTAYVPPIGIAFRYSTFSDTVGAEAVSIDDVTAAPVTSSTTVAMIPPWTLPKGLAMSGVGVHVISAFPSCIRTVFHRPGLSAYGAITYVCSSIGSATAHHRLCVGTFETVAVDRRAGVGRMDRGSVLVLVWLQRAAHRGTCGPSAHRCVLADDLSRRSFPSLLGGGRPVSVAWFMSQRGIGTGTTERANSGNPMLRHCSAPGVTSFRGGLIFTGLPAVCLVWHIGLGCPKAASDGDSRLSHWPHSSASPRPPVARAAAVRPAARTPRGIRVGPRVAAGARRSNTFPPLGLGPLGAYHDSVLDLIMLRHGQSTWNAENLFTGWWDVDLTEVGEAEARAGGKLLGEEPGLDLRVLHTSVLTRAI